MFQVSKSEFDAYIKSQSAIPDGFKLNGSLIQSRFYAKDVEVARRSSDGLKVIYEINEELLRGI